MSKQISTLSIPRSYLPILVGYSIHRVKSKRDSSTSSGDDEVSESFYSLGLDITGSELRSR